MNQILSWEFQGSQFYSALQQHLTVPVESSGSHGPEARDTREIYPETREPRDMEQ